MDNYPLLCVAISLSHMTAPHCLNLRAIYMNIIIKPSKNLKKENGMFIVSGKVVEKLMRTLNLEDNESLHYFHRRLNELGINAKLKELGIKDGDIVQISDYELEWED